MDEIETVNRSVKVDIVSGLQEISPQIFEDGQVNLDKLKALLIGKIIENDDDRFYFNWAGKSGLLKLIQEPGYGTLKPDKDRSVDFDNTENIVIAGENLETLKLLLKPYFGKIKMIYIDPPYNTGKDFIYKDNFKVPVKDYLVKTGQIDSDGSRLSTNTEASGRYHSDWLNFIYPRLFLARSLLTDDGVIFVSIDDHEVHHLRMVMDEIFGEENFVSEIVWHSKYTVANDAKYLSQQHEYLLCFARNKEIIEKLRLPRTIEMNQRYANLDNDKRGPWKATPLHAKSGRGESYVYTFKNGIRWKAPTGRYPRYSQKTLKKLEDDGRIWLGRNGKSTPHVKTYLLEMGDERVSGDLWSYKDVGHTHASNEELADLIGKGIFDNPKPTGLIKQAIQLATNKDGVILDFFAGSGTTGHAVWALNREDGGNRKFILVNLDEEVQDEDVRKEFPTVADICIERLRRVSDKFRKDEQQKLFKNDHDLGFKVFRLDRSNFNLKDEFEFSEEDDIEELKKKYLEWLGLWVDQPLVEGYNPIDVVYETLLKEGFDLNSEIREVAICDNDFFHVIDGNQELEFYLSLDEKISVDTVEAIRTSEYRAQTFVFLDNALTDNDKINLTSFVNLKVI